MQPNNHSLTTTTLQTNLPVPHNELDTVKKALVSWLKQKGFTGHGWLHNHEHEDDPGYTRQSYPLIQLRCPNGKLQLWGMQQGASVLQQMMLMEMLRGFHYKGIQCRIIPQQTKTEEHEIAFTKAKSLQRYELNYFIALSPINFKNWQQLPDAAKRMKRLKELIINNIAMFCKAAGFELEKRKLKLHIDWIWHTRWVLIKDYKVLGFTLTYQCNLLLPDGIALGRQTRLGYGWQMNRTENEIDLVTPLNN